MARPPVTSRTGHRGGKNDCTAPGKVFKPGQQENRAERIRQQEARTSLRSLADDHCRSIGFIERVDRNGEADKGIG